MLNRVMDYLRLQRTMQRINLALSRAATTSGIRNLDPAKPLSWEFCGFSQNGEDGIIDYLCSQLHSANRYFVEIGAADGLENNTAWLAIAKKYSGLMIEGDPLLASRIEKNVASFNLGVQTQNAFVTVENVKDILEDLLFADPDVFSIDIDGNDYYLVKSILEACIRPKIWVVEFNSAFGPEQSITIPYQEDFNFKEAHESGLYYGVSINAWKQLFEPYGYSFVTVESNGVNAFFIDSLCFSPEFIGRLQSKHYAENFFQYSKFKTSWEDQFALIEQMPLEVIA